MRNMYECTNVQPDNKLLMSDQITSLAFHPTDIRVKIWLNITYLLKPPPNHKHMPAMHTLTDQADAHFHSSREYIASAYL